MDLMEYMAKELFGKYDLPIMKSVVVEDGRELLSRTEELKFPVVVKAQVQTGGRGKAGGIQFAENQSELLSAGERILSMQIKGLPVEKILITEKVEVRREWYLSILLDRLAKCPVVIFSPAGGVDIEETARTAPRNVCKVFIDPLVGIQDYVPRYLLSKSGCGLEFFDPFYDLLKKLYKLFCDYDCLLAEINPLAISDENKLIALDGKVTVDDNALGKRPDILAFRDLLKEDALVLEARKSGFLYIPCEADGNIGVVSNGSGMIMSCIDLISQQGMSVAAALDLGGGATAERVGDAIRIVLSNRRVKTLFINIFGGITRCDEVAVGVKSAAEGLPEGKKIIVRFEGTNKEKGLDLLREANGNIGSVEGLIEGVRELVSGRERT